MNLQLKKMKNPSFVFFFCIAAVTVLIIVLFRSYFMDRVFFIYDSKFSLYSKQGNLVTYKSDDHLTLNVRTQGDRRFVTFNNLQYSVLETSPMTYEVEYNDGQQYEVQDLSGNLIQFDKSGEPIFEMGVSVNGHVQSSIGFSPVTIVTAAYPRYHHAQRTPGYLYLALGMIVFGWSLFRYEKLQNFLFRTSSIRLWVDDPEPSDFYYFSCKAGGVLLMVFSVLIALRTL